ncbi:protein phosphatase 4, regulatory subunit 2 [Dimargaris cristalligena]|uniref:PPP4R2-domain-containing protein n=1 Tax=Dimargaris cristalligena TaxID=215637 RepID=A0A4Q0A1T2_9FUNG|nr:protein phosphatase 4, regulatory subunit 2 [Dimargaris cristalligena]RKP39120.1 PPP4R2-domain-containing protein [Dimargaris cristalligena]|eukprot:RKP39120.1 PPP4R2-domain-containing protein [Dimargaris cristalligena]
MTDSAPVPSSPGSIEPAQVDPILTPPPTDEPESTDGGANTTPDHSPASEPAEPTEAQRQLLEIAETNITRHVEWATLQTFIVDEMHQALGRKLDQLPNLKPEERAEQRRDVTAQVERFAALLSEFTGPPFTIQRICELLTIHVGQHKTPLKYLRALEKVILVTSTVDTRSGPINGHASPPRSPSHSPAGAPPKSPDASAEASDKADTSAEPLTESPGPEEVSSIPPSPAVEPPADAPVTAAAATNAPVAETPDAPPDPIATTLSLVDAPTPMAPSSDTRTPSPPLLPTPKPEPEPESEPELGPIPSGIIPAMGSPPAPSSCSEIQPAPPQELQPASPIHMDIGTDDTADPTLMQEDLPMHTHYSNSAEPLDKSTMQLETDPGPSFMNEDTAETDLPMAVTMADATSDMDVGDDADSMETDHN